MRELQRDHHLPKWDNRTIFDELSKLYKKNSKKQQENTEVGTIQNCFLADKMGWV